MPVRRLRAVITEAEVPSGASVAASTAGSLAMYVLVKARGVLLVPLYAWLLDPHGIGVVNLAAAVATLLAPVLHLGLPVGMLVELPHLRNRAAEARGYVTGLLVVATTSLLALVAIPWALHHATLASLADVRPHAWAVALFAAAMALREVAQVIPQLQRETPYLAVLSIGIEYGSAALGLALVARGFGPGGLLWGTGIVMAAGSLAGIRHSLRTTGPAPGRDAVFLRRALSVGLPMLAITTAYTVVQSIDRFFLAHYHGAAAVGIYSISHTVASGVLVLAATVNLVFLPVAVQLLHKNPGRLLTFIQESMRFLVLAVGLCVAGAFLVGAPAVRVLAGPVYDPAGHLLPFLVLGYSLFTVGQLLQWIPMTVTRTVRGVMAGHLAAAVLIVVLDALFIPAHGMAGAAGAAVASYAAGALLMALAARRSLPALRWQPIVRPAAAAAGAVLTCALLRLPSEAPGAAAAAAGVALIIGYAALATAVGAVRGRDYDLLRSVIGGRAPEDPQA